MSIKSRLYQLALSDSQLALSRAVWRAGRLLRGTSASLRLYFSVDDPHAYLLLRMARLLVKGYAVEIEFCLLGHDSTTPDDRTRMWRRWVSGDATVFARALGEPVFQPPADRWLRGFETALATSWRLHADLERIVALCETFYRHDEAAMAAATSRLTANDQSHAVIQLRKSQALLDADKHYASGAIYFDGEAYRGVERMRHLTNRLRKEGLATGDAAVRQTLAGKLDKIERRTGQALVATQWRGKPATFFFSFRSPYSRLAIGYVRRMANAAKLDLQLCPVMPMVARGVPLSDVKRRYLVTDAAREARRHGIAFGNIVDPIGEGVRHAMAGFFAAKSAGKEAAFAEAAMQAIWSHGRRLDRMDDLALLLRPLGLPVSAAERLLTDPLIDKTLGENADALMRLGHWGVPVLAIDGYAVWGQDRLWQFASLEAPSI